MNSKYLEKFADIENCPVRQVMDRLGDKWSVMILLILKEEGTQRFSELGRCIGDISQKMLTTTLRSLEADGLIARKVYPEVPPRVEYNITKLGISLHPHIEQLANWSISNMNAVLSNRKKYSAKIKN